MLGTLGGVDITVFVMFIAAVIGVGLFKSKGEDTHGEEGAADYFLAGRGLSWWLIGFSLIAANISAEQFVGMSGQGAGLYGLSVSSWEWCAAIALVVVAFALLPYFLRSGITTIPEFLELRYNHWARLFMTLSMMLILIGVSLVGVIYAGALTLKQLMVEYNVDLSLAGACWALGVMAAIYVAVGGLKACAWADLLQGSALIVGGGIITYYAFAALDHSAVTDLIAANGAAAAVDSSAGVISKFSALNESAMHMGSNVEMPWPILLLGIWIPNFYYWGLNQYITQRILGSASLAEGQKGLVLAAGLKLIVPFFIVIPGIIAFNLYSKDMEQNANAESYFASYKQAVEDESNVLIFDINEKWAKAHPEKAAEMTKFNESVTAKVGAEKVKMVNMATATLAPYEAAVAAGDSDKVFKMDAKWEKANPEKGAEIEAYNAAVIARVGEDKVDSVELKSYKYDSALGLLITRLIPKNKGILGFVIAALLGAIVSSLAAVLNAASTLLTMDVYQRYINQAASQFKLVTMGRVFIGVFVIFGCAVSPLLANNSSVFEYIQKFQGFVSTGILAVFIYGLFNRTSARWAGVIGLVLNPIVYYILTTVWPDVHYLYSMSYSLVIVLAVLTVYGLIWKQEKVVFATNTSMDLTSSKGALIIGLGVCALTVALYIKFW
jgi:SSS family solute:Na+ symporter